jgi:hypothetical protein
MVRDRTVRTTQEDANDPNDHASLEERFPEKAVVLTLICGASITEDHALLSLPSDLLNMSLCFMSAARLTG